MTAERTADAAVSTTAARSSPNTGRRGRVSRGCRAALGESVSECSSAGAARGRSRSISAACTARTCCFGRSGDGRAGIVSTAKWTGRVQRLLHVVPNESRCQTDGDPDKRSSQKSPCGPRSNGYCPHPTLGNFRVEPFRPSYAHEPRLGTERLSTGNKLLDTPASPRYSVGHADITE